jgi:hypothetical protein
MPFLMGLGVGIGINNAKAVLEAIWSAIRRQPSEFIRTPKYGATGAGRTKWQFGGNGVGGAGGGVGGGVRQSVFTFKRLTLPILEIAFGCYMASCLWISLYYQCGIYPWQDKSGWASVPFLVIFAGGYFYVGFGTLYAMYKMNQDAEEVPAVEVAEVGGIGGI